MTLWALLTYILLQNIKKLERGTLLRQKVAQCRKKLNRLVSPGFVGYGKKVKNERGDPLAVISADRTWPLMLLVLVVSIVRKVAQSE